MKEVIALEPLKESFNVFWHLTDFCNYNCSYCPPWLKAGDFHQGRKTGFPTDDEMRTFMDNLENEYLRGRKLNLMMSGGEPTIHKMFPEIVERLKKHGVIIVTTNGSRPLNWWKSLKEVPTGINMSLHHETTNTDKVNELLDYLVGERGVQVRFNLVCDPNNWDESMRLFNGLRPEYQNFVLAWPLHDPSPIPERDIYTYTHEQQEWMKLRNKRLANYRVAYGSKFMDEQTIVRFSDGTRRMMSEISETTFKLQKMNYFKGWNCSAGIDSIDINFSGEVWSSICKSVKLGRINDFKLLEAQQVCPKELCIHPADLAIRKSKPNA